MNRRPNNQRELDQAMRRLFERNTMKNIPDLTRYMVMVNGKPVVLGERINEIKDGKTVSVIAAQLDSHGVTHSGQIKDFIKCACGCCLNVKVHRLSKCLLCRQIICLQHSFSFNSNTKELTFCKKPICWLSGRVCQILYYSIQLIKLIISHSFGINFNNNKNIFQPSQLSASMADLGGDDDLKAIDFKRIESNKGRTLDRDFQ